MGFFGTLKAMNQLAKAFNGVHHTLNNIENSAYNEDNAFTLCVMTYIYRVGILERIKENDIKIQSPILVPAISNGNVSIEYALELIFNQLEKLSLEYGISSNVQEILERKSFFYEIERNLPKGIKI